MRPILNGRERVIDCKFTIRSPTSEGITLISGITFTLMIDDVLYPTISIDGDENTNYSFSVPQLIPYIHPILTYTGVVTIVSDAVSATANVQFTPVQSPLCDQASISETSAIQIPRLSAIQVTPATNFFGEIRIRFKAYDGDEFNMVGSNWCSGYDTTLPVTVSECPVAIQPAKYSENSRDIILNVSPVNDKPVVECGASSYTFYDGCPAVYIGGEIRISDIDDTELSWARLRIQPDNGTCQLASEVSTWPISLGYWM